MVKKVSSPNKLKYSFKINKARARMNGVDTKTKEKIKKPIKFEKGTTLDNCNLDNLTLE